MQNLLVHLSVFLMSRRVRTKSFLLKFPILNTIENQLFSPMIFPLMGSSAMVSPTCLPFATSCYHALGSFPGPQKASPHTSLTLGGQFPLPPILCHTPANFLLGPLEAFYLKGGCSTPYLPGANWGPFQLPVPSSSIGFNPVRQQWELWGFSQGQCSCLLPAWLPILSSSAAPSHL